MTARDYVMALALAVPLLVVGCTDIATDEERGPIGKADLVGSCEGHCDGPSDGNCWCDELCTLFEDCCEDKAAVCDGAFDSCAGKSCGDECTICDPADSGCNETSVIKLCNTDGACEATVPECGGGDNCCDPEEAPGANGSPFCIEGASCCADGSWQCNIGNGSPSCDTGNVCGEDCCDPEEAPGANGSPFCIEGASCCADGSWQCNIGNGSPSCDTGNVCEAFDSCAGKSCGESCTICDPFDPNCSESAVLKMCDADGVCQTGFAECDGGGDCCDPDEAPGANGNPFCFEGASCCDDGTWQCNLGNGQPSCNTLGDVCGADECTQQGDSCANGESCCGGLSCCGGIPIPAGQEFCSDFCPISDREKKANFVMVDTSAVLEKVVAMPISTWNYKEDGAQVRHMGPMAQDFKGAFGLGSTDKSIFMVDGDGVALASIQALNKKLKELEADNKKLREDLAVIKKTLGQLGSK